MTAAVEVETGASRLLALERAGLVRRAQSVAEVGPEGSLPVVAELRGVLPGGLRRGATVAVAPDGVASTSLLLLVLAAASQSGAWCGVVGLPSLNPALAQEMGVALDRLALLPSVGSEWSSAAAVLLDGLDVVVVVPGQVPSVGLCGRLSARARQRGAVLMPFGGWAQPDVTLLAEAGVWEGLSQGRGRVQCREVSVVARGRGGGMRPRRAMMWLPQPSGLYAQMQQWRKPVTDPSRRLTIVPAALGAAGAGDVEAWSAVAS